MNNLFGHLMRQYAKRKGDLQNDLKQCSYCGKCERCRAKAITVSREEKKWEWNEERCYRCGQCIHGCPMKSLGFVNTKRIV